MSNGAELRQTGTNGTAEGTESTATTACYESSVDILISKLAAAKKESLEDSKEDPSAVPESFLGTDPASGLSDAEARLRRKAWGSNTMRAEKENKILKFLKYFIGPIQFVMEAAAALAAGLQDWVDLGVICGLLLLNACVGAWQDFHAGSVVDALKKTLKTKARVLREGVFQDIEIEMIVPGDIVSVEEGSIIPADGRVITEFAHLQVDQSAMTGESMAVTRLVGDHCYASSLIKRGEAHLVVTATGDHTFMGRMASMVTDAEAGAGHFTEVITNIGKTLLYLVIVTLVAVWISSLYRGLPSARILRFTLAITVIGVPVGLPAVVTTTMAVGASFLAKKQAIVQKLSAIESLAGVEILCSDKTGTLTKNRLTLGEPYTTEGTEAGHLVLTACLAASHNEKGLDAIDKAFLTAIAQYPAARATLAQCKVLEFTPFDPVSKKVTAVVNTPDIDHMTCVKGAPLTVLHMVMRDGTVSEEAERAYKDKVEEFASRGFRSLGVACKTSVERWKILGIMPCTDPPRHDTAKTIEEAKSLGLQIKMLTGDAVAIARETSRELGLGTKIYSAETLRVADGSNAADIARSSFIDAADGFAEVFPEHKFQVVQILQQRGNLVAMTGDGVNDAPSLKKADTGIAVEGASEAARAAADIVFLAPGLSAIIDALKTSRQIFHRMYAYIVYRIALSLHLEIFLGLWIAIFADSLDNDLIVFIAIFADLATLAVAYDRAPYSKTPVKWRLPRLWFTSILLGIVLAAGTWACFALTQAGCMDDKTCPIRFINGMAEPGEKTSIHAILFLEIVLTQNWLIFITRGDGSPTWASRPSWKLVAAIFLVDAAATAMAVFGLFLPGKPRMGAMTVIRVWAFSILVFSALFGVYWIRMR